MKCVIVAAGDICDYGAVKGYIDSDDYVIVADGGIRHLIPLGISGDWFLGDLDSAMNDKNVNAVNWEKFPSEKDDTDTMLAIKHGLLKGFSEFVILGGLGGRLDHTIANLSALEYLRDHGAFGALVDERTTVRFLCEGDSAAPSMSDAYFSVFPYGCAKAVVSASGLKFPMDRCELHSGFPLGVSNRVTDPAKFSMTIHEGRVILVECGAK